MYKLFLQLYEITLNIRRALLVLGSYATFEIDQPGCKRFTYGS